MYPNPQDALPLPPHPSLEQYRKRAKDLVAACKAGEAAGIGEWTTEWIEHLDALYRQPERARQPAELASRISEVEQFFRVKLLGEGRQRSRCSLAQAQFVIARAHGFAGWPKLANHLEALDQENSAVSAFEAAADAIVSGDSAGLARLLRERPELIRARSTREHRSTLLHYVSANGVENYRQRTPNNAVDIARIRLAAGAEVDAEADVYGGGATTLGLVATSAHPRAVGVQNDWIDVLLRNGARMDLQGAGNKHNMVYACLANGCPEAAAHLVTRGAPVDLPAAAGIGRLDLVKTFFDHDGLPNPSTTKTEIHEAFGQACIHGHAEAADFLLQRGADVRARLRIVGAGHTALHVAAWGGHIDVVKLLIRHRAPLDESDETWGTPPIGWALHGWSTNRSAPPGRYGEVVAMLANAGAAVKAEWLNDTNVRADPKLLATLQSRAEGGIERFSTS